jgi:tetratricopeptide (TPR) repeat protein
LPARHRSVRAVFDHSWDLLSESGRSALASLSLFRTPFSFEAAERVAGADADVIFELQQHSLLSTTAGGRLQLHELIRRYAGDKLSPDSRRTRAQRRHAAYFAALVTGRLEEAAGDEVAAAVAELRPVWPDVRAAWRRAVEDPDPVLLEQMLTGVSHYLTHNSRPDVAATLFGPASAATAAHGGALHQRLQLQHGLSLMRAGKYVAAQPVLTGSLTTAVESGEVRFEAESRLYLAHLLLRLGEMSAAHDHLERGLRAATAAGWAKGEGDLLRGLGNYALARGYLADARRFYERSLAVSEHLDDVRGTGATIGNLGALCRQLGDYAAARDYSQRSLAIQQEIGDAKSEGSVRVDLGFLALDQAELDEAERQFAAAAELYRRIEQPHYLADAWQGQGCVALARGDIVAAERLLFRAEKMYRDVDEQLYASGSRLRRAEVRLRMEAYAEARDMLEALLADGRQVVGELLACECLILLSLLLRLTGELPEALARAEEAVTLAAGRDYAPLVAAALSQRGAARRALGQIAAARADLERAHTALVTLGLEHVAAEPLAGLLSLALEREADGAELRSLLTPLLAALDRYEGFGIWETSRVYRVAVRALQRLDDPRAVDLERHVAARSEARADAVRRQAWRQAL